jgi:hypothetical protein
MLVLCLVFCWPCVVVYQYCKTNEMHFLYSIYYELTACTCFWHYLLILRRRCTNNNWYIECELCVLAASRIGVELVILSNAWKVYNTRIKFLKRIQNFCRSAWIERTPGRPRHRWDVSQRKMIEGITEFALSGEGRRTGSFKHGYNFHNAFLTVYQKLNR